MFVFVVALGLAMLVVWWWACEATEPWRDPENRDARPALTLL